MTTRYWSVPDPSVNVWQRTSVARLKHVRAVHTLSPLWICRSVSARELRTSSSQLAIFRPSIICENLLLHSLLSWGKLAGI